MSFSEENGIPRVLLILKEKNPEAIVGNDEFPALTNRAELGGFLGAEELEDLDEYVEGNPVEVAG